jgi:hypothetical protein
MPTTAGRLTIADMPAALPVFPLTGVLLLPRGKLPLNIFEPRYMAMVEDALARPDKLVGMIQPVEKERKGKAQPLYPVGCAGRITSWSETEDGRYLIQLTGIARFAIGAEIATTRGYRMFEPEFERFADDFAEPHPGGFDRVRLVAALKSFFAAEGLEGDWNSIEQAPDERIVNTLAMLCPFAPDEKQALLECATLAERAKAMTGICEARAAGGTPPPDAPRH